MMKGPPHSTVRAGMWSTWCLRAVRSPPLNMPTKQARRERMPCATGSLVRRLHPWSPWPTHSFEDVVLNFGLQWALLKAEEAPLLSSSANVVEVADEDGDRVLDGQDSRLGTVPGSAVDQAGCPAEQALDS